MRVRCFPRCRKKLRQEIETLKSQGKIDRAYTNLDRIFDYKQPYIPERTCHINKMGMLAVVTPEGDVYHNISEIVMADFRIGNLHEKTLDEMWNSESHIDVKKKLHDLWMSGKCENCRAIGFNQRINEVLKGLPDKPDPLI